MHHSHRHERLLFPDELKSNLKSSYKELEKAPKSSVSRTSSHSKSSGNDDLCQGLASSRLSKNIRKQENEYNLAQSKLQLILSNSSSRTNLCHVILFSSAYQRQDWIDLIEKTKQELVRRSSTLLNPVNTHHQRLTESLVQKRLDFIKVNAQEPNPQDSIVPIQATKTYSGTLHITIHSIHGSALSHSTPQQQPTSSLNTYQFYVAVEIDSYNTFYPYAQTAKQPMQQQQECVEFRGEVKSSASTNHSFILLLSTGISSGTGIFSCLSFARVSDRSECENAVATTRMHRQIPS